MNYAALTISILALLFTIFSFWWMNWRRGKLHVGRPRSYAAIGSEQGKMVVELPLLFFNSGPMPIVVENLRLLFSDEVDVRPLDFIATVEKIGTNQSRAFATQFPVRGRESVLHICEFQRQPGGLIFETKGYRVRLQAMLNGSDKWKTILEFSLNVSQIDLSTINRSLVVHDNMTGG